MGISIRPSRALFAAVMIGLGIIGLIYGNSALIWEPIRKTLPGRPVIIYLCAVIEIGTGIGLLLRPSVILACRVLFPFLLLWMALLKLPGLFLAPHVMVSWEAFGEIAATSAGGWCLFAAHAGAWEQWHLKFAIGESGIRAARLLLVAALPMIGLSHFVYHVSRVIQFSPSVVIENSPPSGGPQLIAVADSSVRISPALSFSF